MSLGFCRAKSELLYHFAGQGIKALLFCGAKNKDFVILRGKIFIALIFCKAKSALFHNFAGQGQDFKGKNRETIFFNYIYFF